MIKDYQTKDIRNYPTKDIRKTPNKDGKIFKRSDLWKFKWRSLIKKLSKVSDTVEKET